MATMVPRRDLLKVVKVHQVEKDAIIVCYGNVIQVVTLQGNPKQHKKMVSQLNFDFNVDSIGKRTSFLLECQQKLHSSRSQRIGKCGL